MRLEKKDWISPRTGFQEFTPQEFIAGCYHVHCKTDASNGNYRYVYLDSNGDGILNDGDGLIYSAAPGSFVGCNVVHTGVQSDGDLALNAFVSTHTIRNQSAYNCHTTRVYYWNQQTAQYGNVHMCYDPTSADYIAERPNAS
ncbi:MAG: hypothetical protein IJ726_05620 [Phocaeicola sp.]|nr:hypothetical protein [Phocaeicola sp.]